MVRDLIEDKMGHFAKVVDGVVRDIIVAEPDFFDFFNDPEPGQWIQTSYNTRGGVHYEPNTNTPSSDQSKALRKNHPGVGYLYHADLDAFSPPQPFPSWTLDPDTCWWVPPVPEPLPQAGKSFVWDEENQRWVEWSWDDNTQSWVEETGA
jgi:hypothetical protein